MGRNWKHFCANQEHSYANHYSPIQASNAKPDYEHARVRAAKGNQLDKRVCIRITVKSARPPDPDGIDAKAAIDGIIQSGLLRDDTAKTIEEVRFRSEVAKEDETVIEIWENEAP